MRPPSPPDHAGGRGSGPEAPFVPTVVDAVGRCEEGDEGLELSHELDTANESEDTASNGDAPHCLRRKQLNRIAAQKCRRRRKEKALQAQKDVHELQTRNTELKWKLSELSHVKAQLCELVRVHCSGTNIDELLQTVSALGGQEAAGSSEPRLRY